jgi:hypothetical protein
MAIHTNFTIAVKVVEYHVLPGQRVLVGCNFLAKDG